MLKKEITYTDYTGKKKTKVFRFHLSRAELMKMEMTCEGSLKEKLIAMVKEQNKVKLYEYFEYLVKSSYGIRSDDGERFEKSDEISKAFTESEAYSELMVELCSGEQKVIEFVNGIMPTPVPEEEQKKVIEMASKLDV